MEPVHKITLTIHGRKDLPLHFCKLPDFLVKDLPDLMARELQINPAATVDDVVRSIWRLGSAQLNKNISRGISARADANNPPMTTKPAEPTETAKDDSKTANV